MEGGVPQATLRRATPAVVTSQPTRGLPPLAGIAPYIPKSVAAVVAGGGPLVPRRQPMPAVTAMPQWQQLVGWSLDQAAPTPATAPQPAPAPPQPKPALPEASVTPLPLRPIAVAPAIPAPTPRPFPAVVSNARPATGTAFVHVTRRSTTEEFPGATPGEPSRPDIPMALPVTAAVSTDVALPVSPPTAPPAAPQPSRFTYVRRAVTEELPVMRPVTPVAVPGPAWLDDPEVRPMFMTDAPPEALASWTKRERYNLARLIGAVALRDVGTLAVGMTAQEMEDLVQRAARAGLLRV